MIEDAKVLVVDDNEDNVELVCQVLEDYYTVITASSGQECLDKAESELPDLILLDVMMPGMDGYEVLKRVSENEKLSHIPVIFLTARYKDIDRIVKGLALGAFDYITKPFEDEILVARVDVALRVKKAEDRLRDKTMEVAEKNRKLENFKNSISMFTDQLIEFGKDGDLDSIGLDFIDDDVRNMARIFYDVVSARSRAEQLVRIREEERKQILDNMVSGVIIIDEDGLIHNFNRMAEKIFGYQAEDIIGKNVTSLMNEHDARHHAEYIRNYTETGEYKIIGIGREITALNSKKHQVPIHISIAQLPGLVDGKRRFIGSCIDMTVQRRQEEQLRRAQKMDAIGNLTGGIAHDYNNMLGVISGFSEILKLKLTENSELREYVEQIQHACDRGVQLTRKMLAVSRNKTSENHICNINDVLTGEQVILEKSLTARIELNLDLQDDLWNVYVDEGDLEDCILNITINAMHAMPESGKLVIATRNVELSHNQASALGLESGEYVTLSIRDTGHGIEKSQIDKIFDPFYSSKGTKGTGLGLSQVYGFVQRSSGRIDVESSPGTGTCFTLYFPRCNEESTDEEQSDVQPVPEKQGVGTILVVDDEPSFRELLNVMLTDYGYNVVLADSGEQALEILKDCKPDLVLTDVVMKDMDGYQLAEKIQKLDPEIRIQLMSGYSDKKGSSDLSKSLCSNILEKPVSNTALLNRLRTLLSSDNAYSGKVNRA